MIQQSLQTYRREIEYHSKLAFYLKWLGNISLLAFILIIIFVKDIHIKYSILTYYSILCRLGGMLVFKYYEIPTLLHEFAQDKEEYFEIIHANRSEILKAFFKNIYGLGFDRNLLDINSEELKKLILGLERKNWKKAGKFFSIFFIFMTLITIWVLSL